MSKNGQPGLEETPDRKIITYNKYQLLAATVLARIEVHIWPRGFGKSTGLIGNRARHNMTSMIRSAGVMVAPTFVGLLQKTLPPVLEGLAKFGWVEGEDYVIGQPPPKSWPKLYVYPRMWKYFLSTKIGSGIHLISQDRKGTSNGLSVDWHIADESKLLNKQQYDDETTQTLRGNEKIFEGISAHQSRLFCSDQPTSPHGKWLYDFEEPSKRDAHKVQEILVLEEERNELLISIESGGLSKSSQKTYLYRIHRLDARLFELRKDLTYFTEPTPMEAIQALGPKYVREQKSNMSSDFLFRTSILNMRAPKISGAFYSTFDDRIHTHNAVDYAHVDSIEYKMSQLGNLNDCRTDADFNRADKLYIGMDYNYSVNNLVVGQPDRDDPMHFLVLNHLFVKERPLRDLAIAFTSYYQYAPRKEVDFLYDHTALQGRNAVANIIFWKEFATQLRKRGWLVNPIFIGVTATHQSRYEYFGKVFQGRSMGHPTVSINRRNCPHLIVALNNTEAKQARGGFEKNKKFERDNSIDQAETTHVTDAFDTLVYGKYYVQRNLSHDGDPLGIIY